MYDTNIYSRVNKTSSHLHKINDIVRIPKTEYTQNQFYKKFNVLNTEELFRITDIKKTDTHIYINFQIYQMKKLLEVFIV